ncbi:MAG: hypothetical protein ACJ761_01825 [Chloroflexota bacterium]
MDTLTALAGLSLAIVIPALVAAAIVVVAGSDSDGSSLGTFFQPLVGSAPADGATSRPAVPEPEPVRWRLDRLSRAPI